MRPLGRFFQVTETVDFKKYFLDIDKVEKYPVSCVIKSTNDISVLKEKIRRNALKLYPVQAIIDEYMKCIEEIINIPVLIERFETAISNGYLNNIIDEIILQSKIEFDLE